MIYSRSIDWLFFFKFPLPFATVLNTRDDFVGKQKTNRPAEETEEMVHSRVANPSETPRTEYINTNAAPCTNCSLIQHTYTQRGYTI